MKPRMRHNRRERGAAAVEFALVAPLLILLVFGIIDFGYMINRATVVNNAARDAVRIASLDGSYDEIRQTVVGELSDSGIPADAPTTRIMICADADVAASCDADEPDYDSRAASGSVATVKIEYHYQWITPVIAGIFGDSTTVTKHSEMRVE